ncbi:MAG: hypothetical protein AB1546_12390, partial [bacterium]
MALLSSHTGFFQVDAVLKEAEELLSLNFIEESYDSIQWVQGELDKRLTDSKVIPVDIAAK